MPRVQGQRLVAGVVPVLALESEQELPPLLQAPVEDAPLPAATAPRPVLPAPFVAAVAIVTVIVVAAAVLAPAAVVTTLAAVVEETIGLVPCLWALVEARAELCVLVGMSRARCLHHLLS